MTLIHFTLFVIGLALVLVWFMYSAGVHGTFRFRWLEWENWTLILGIVICSGIPLRATLGKSGKGAGGHPHGKKSR